MTFGGLLKELRINRGLTLRQCCLDLDYDPSNWSKLERGINPAPANQETLERWAKYFEIDPQQKQEFIDLACLSRQELPRDIASDEVVLKALPVFFRAARGNDLEGEKLNQFIEDIRSLHSPSRET